MKTPFRTGLFTLALWLGAFAVHAQTVTVAGLTAPIEIVTDREGVPHINAASIEDAFFGQGYAAASARLWQMDIGRRRALGELAAAFGPDFVKYDRAARLVLFRGDLAAEWRHYDPRVPGIAAAWVRGVNARVREVRANPALLPPEFAALAVLPEIRSCPMGLLGDGNLHFNFKAPEGMSREAFMQYKGAVTRAVNDTLLAYGGSISAEHGIGSEKVGELAHYADPVKMATMRAIKRALDPQNIMNPGKIFTV